MGFFDALFPKREQQKQLQGFYKMLSTYQPVFTSWNGALYESERIRAAIDARSRNIAKLKVEINGSAKPVLQTRLRHAPNSWQTWYQFMYRLNTILDMQNTAFIIPTYDKLGEVVGVYPILPSQSELVQTKDNVPYIRYTFYNGEKAALELAKVGIMTKFQYKHDFFGSSNGDAMRPTMELIDIQNQGIKEGVKSAATFRFMAQLSNYADDEDLKAERKRFTEKNLKGDGGFLLFPNTYSNIKQIDSKPFVVDFNQMNAIDKNIRYYFGVSEKVLENSAFGDEWSAFYEGAIEPFAIQFSEVMTKMLFTPLEQSNGAMVMATANRLQYMTNEDKLKVSAQMLDRGIMSRNEVRDIWNLPPIEDGDSYIIRGEYYDASNKLADDEEQENEDANQE